MPESLKKKRLEKTEIASLANPVSKNAYCYRCGRAYPRRKNYFPATHSQMYRSAGYLPWCNNCIDEMYQSYRVKLGSDRAALRRMCQKMDIYYNEALYRSVEETAPSHSLIRKYIGKTNIIRHIDKTFDDTLLEEEESNTPWHDDFPAEDTPVSNTEGTKVDQSVIDFWGAGFDDDFYAELERRYKDWTGGREDLPPAERLLYKQICMQEVIIVKEAAMGNPTDKAVNTLNNLLGSMKLKPAQQKSDADTELEKMPLGVGIQKWEYSRPLPETPKENRDIRNVVKNITTWYLGHACKMVGLKNSYCKAYESAMEELRVKRPEYDDEDDDTMLNDIFNGGSASEDDEL